MFLLPTITPPTSLASISHKIPPIIKFSLQTFYFKRMIPSSNFHHTSSILKSKQLSNFHCDLPILCSNFSNCEFVILLCETNCHTAAAAKLLLEAFSISTDSDFILQQFLASGFLGSFLLSVSNKWFVVSVGKQVHSFFLFSFYLIY
jgi:hypothetical protein